MHHMPASVAGDEVQPPMRSEPNHAGDTHRREREVGKHVCRVREAEPCRWSANWW